MVMMVIVVRSYCIGIELIIISCCIEAFLNSVVAANLDYSTNINPSYNVMAVFSAIQVAIQSFMDKFITVWC